VPAKVVQIVWSYRRQSCATPEFFVRELSVVFELLASSLNFLIYCVFLRRFRRSFIAGASCGRRTELAAGRDVRPREDWDVDDGQAQSTPDVNSLSLTARM